ncbi:hypothetical protein JVU11DRAFT_10544 [Chiua virens]|nr:hypothetical protein JVU11DRAFT_10544 [Chiua virens]
MKQTIGEIREKCSKCHTKDFIKFLKYAKLYGLNGVDIPFWIDWPLLVPAKFLKPETMVGYRAFKEGVSKLKQVTGCDHQSMQCYIISVITSAVPQRFLTAVCALLDFQYLTQMPSFDNQVLQQLDNALLMFHNHKDAIITAGGWSKHFNIPKLKLLQHIIPSICESGAVMQWSADTTEHAHVTEVKNPGVCWK